MTNRVRVRPHFRRSNGSFVAPHYRSSPKRSVFSNFSFSGNYNPNALRTALGNQLNSPVQSDIGDYVNSRRFVQTTVWQSVSLFRATNVRLPWNATPVQPEHPSLQVFRDAVGAWDIANRPFSPLREAMVKEMMEDAVNRSRYNSVGS